LGARAAVDLAEGAPEVYEVRPGDTLWSIAGRFLRDPWRWPEVWDANAEVGDPNRIFPGERLRLVRGAGGPRVVRDTGATDGMRVVRLSPRVRASALENAVPMIPVSSIAPFLTRPWVADSDTIKRVPYVVGFPDDRTIAGAHDPIFVRRIDSTAVTEFEILRPGDPLRDPQTNRVLGYEATYIGNATLERAGDPAILRVVSSAREVAIGDRVIPASLEAPLENFFPRPAPERMRGQIISVMSGVSQIGQYDVVVINRGKRQQVEAGHVFEIYRGGDQARDQVRDSEQQWNWRRETPATMGFWLGDDWKADGWVRDGPDPNDPLPLHAQLHRERGTYVRPLQRSGILMVFRPFEEVSFALILSAHTAMRVGDQVAPPPAPPS
jgi:hypothetical protein